MKGRRDRNREAVARTRHMLGVWVFEGGAGGPVFRADNRGGAGGAGGRRNLPRELIRAVRKRKGLVTEDKVVESATRQRTLARKV